MRIAKLLSVVSVQLVLFSIINSKILFGLSTIILLQLKRRIFQRLHDVQSCNKETEEADIRLPLFSIKADIKDVSKNIKHFHSLNFFFVWKIRFFFKCDINYNGLIFEWINKYFKVLLV